MVFILKKTLPKCQRLLLIIYKKREGTLLYPCTSFGNIGSIQKSFRNFCLSFLCHFHPNISLTLKQTILYHKGQALRAVSYVRTFSHVPQHVFSKLSGLSGNHPGTNPPKAVDHLTLGIYHALGHPPFFMNRKIF